MTSEEKIPAQSEPSQSRSASVPATGSRIAHFIIRETLGEGGMGVVFDAHDENLQRDVAIKLLRIEDDERLKGKEQQRLLREAQAMALLSHPNLVTIYEVGTHGDDVFLAMEKVEGVTLQRWLDHNPPIEEVVEVFHQAAQALQAVHDAGLVHRDFKPSNVVVTPDNRAKLLDLGIARRAGDVMENAATAPLRKQAIQEAVEGITLDSGKLNMLDATLTRAGELVGTPGYMAPEQLLGQSVSPQSDQFSFGVALYEALTGERPFRGSTDLQIISNVVAGARKEWPRVLSIPDALQAAVDRALAPKPKDRFPSIAELGSACREALGLRGRLKYLTDRWIEHGKDPSYLLSSRALLIDAESLLADPDVRLNAEQESFLQVSRAASGRRRISRRMMVSATGVLTGGLIVTGWGLYRSNRQIDDTVQSQVRNNLKTTRDMLARTFNQDGSALKLLFEQRGMWLTNISRLGRVARYGDAARENAVRGVVEDLNRYFAPVLEGLEQLAALRIASNRFEYLLLDVPITAGNGQSYRYYNRVVDVDAWGKTAFQQFTSAEGKPEVRTQWLLEGEFDRTGRVWKGYDPNSRPWLHRGVAAQKGDSVGWTLPGLLRASQRPGVTGTIPWSHEGERYVLCADFDLTDLSMMTAGIDAPGLWIVIVNREGEVLGLPQQPRFSSKERITRFFKGYAQAQGEAGDAGFDEVGSLPKLGDLSVPELTVAYEIARERGPEEFIFTFDDQELRAAWSEAAANLRVLVVQRPEVTTPV